MTEKFLPVRYQGERKVGGYFGFRMQDTHNDLTMGSSSYAPGDTIKLHLAANNGGSKHSIDCFKFKIFRKISYKRMDKKIITSEYLNYEKVDGVKKFERISKDFECPIPRFEADGSTPLRGSTCSDNFTVQYYLRFFTKVKSIFEVGQGHCI
jgi:hypothetical protein